MKTKVEGQKKHVVYRNSLTVNRQVKTTKCPTSQEFKQSGHQKFHRTTSVNLQNGDIRNLSKPPTCTMLTASS
jgi:hypothetical protein